MKHYRASHVSRVGMRRGFRQKVVQVLSFRGFSKKIHGQDIFMISPLVGVVMIEWILNIHVFWDITPCRLLKWLPTFGKRNVLPKRR